VSERSPVPLASRGRAALEAVFPAAAVSSWVWLEPLGRTRALDLAFGLVLAVVLLLLEKRGGFPSAEDAGLGRGAPHARAIARSLAAVLPLLVALVAWGGLSGRLYASAALPRALLLYPLGALVQDAVVFVFVLPRLEAVAGQRAGLAATALLFGATHLPNPLLTVGSALLVLALSISWRRDRSLVALALAHGLLGAVFDKAIHVSMRIGAPYFR